MLTHERPYSCYECAKTFKSEAALNKHLSNEHASTIYFVDEVVLPETQDEVFIIGA